MAGNKSLTLFGSIHDKNQIKWQVFHGEELQNYSVNRKFGKSTNRNHPFLAKQWEKDCRSVQDKL